MTNYTFMDLLKLSKKQNCGDQNKIIKLAILADSAPQHLKTALKGFGQAENICLEIFDAGYDQIDLQIYDESSELYQFQPDTVILFMCTQKLYENFCGSSDRKGFSDRILGQVKDYHKRIEAGINANIIQPFFIEENDRVYGNFGLGLETSFIYQVKKLNFALMQAAAEDKRVFLIDFNDIRGRVGAEKFCDLAQYCNSKMALSLEALPEVAFEIVSIIKAALGKGKKCVVLDLDNTLWGGVIGDDGLEGIELGELGIGHAFCDFQLWLKELKKRGMLLCVCSKNNEDIAKEPFEKHPDMVLKLEDITMFVANWEDKVSNIRFIQETLNIGMDSFVFIDDNPFERELIKNMIPEITVPDMPEDPAYYRTYLQNLNLFETVSFSENDEKRTKQYRQELERNQLQKDFGNFDDYLKSLAMKGKARAFEKYYYPRIAQLTQRSNQFNLRTVRYTEGDIERITSDPKYFTLYFTLEDKFGDYGLVSVIIMKQLDAETAFIDTWLMSCRVLKRGMEEFVANSMIACAKSNGFRKVRGEYIRTPKNAMVEHLYEQFDFMKIGHGMYEIEVDNYIPREHFIGFEEGE